VNTDIKDNLIRASGTFFAVPWQTSGGSKEKIFFFLYFFFFPTMFACLFSFTALYVHPIGKAGKAPDSPFLFQAHKDSILDFEFSPFDDFIVATGKKKKKRINVVLFKI
jgi:hypothetical protein